MLARRPARNLPSPFATGNGSPARGPTSPLERNPQSSKGWKKRESDGVGLGILAKLNRTRTRGGGATGQIPIGPLRPAEMGWAARRAYNANPSAAEEDFQVADFLSCCYLCEKRLHGKDIYMYRGEKAFCSIECRYQQIVSDECMEKL